jgi:hypothetical protein
MLTLFQIGESTVRNKLAHGLHDVSIADPEIVEWCNTLETPRTVPIVADSHRDRLQLAITLLVGQLRLTAFKAAKERRIVPQEPKVKWYAVTDEPGDS